MPNREKNPNHDSLFKYCLTEPEMARDFLSFYLSEEVRVLCDLTTLKLESSSFVDQQLRQLHSDMLYSVETTQGNGYIYCLIEHQSTPEPLMAWRLMYYAMSAMAAHLKKGYSELPLVAPLLFYHGNIRPYPYSNRWLDCFAFSERATNLYSQPFSLIDLSVISDEEIMTHKSIALLEMVQKHIRCRDILEWLPQLIQIINAGHNSVEQRNVILRYILLNGHTLNHPQLVHQLIEQTPENKEMVMTVAEQLRQEGRIEGIEKGMEKGMEKGREDNKREMVRKLLQLGVSMDLIIASSGLSVDEIKTLN